MNTPNELIKLRSLAVAGEAGKPTLLDSIAAALCTTANTAMAMDPSASATTVTVTAIGFKTKL